MVVVPSRLRRRDVPRRGVVDVLSIEPGAATARSLERRLGHLARESGLTLRVTGFVESYVALVQLARAGFGHGLPPRGVAHALGVDRRTALLLPEPGLTRPIRFVARPTTFAQPLVAGLRSAIAASAPSAV